MTNASPLSTKSDLSANSVDLVRHSPEFFPKSVEKEKDEDTHDEHHDEEHNHEHHEEEHDHEHNEDVIEEIEFDGCCHHHVRSKSFEWLHPMLHCLKISAFILIVNILLGCVTHIWIGEDALINFMSNSFWLQPLLAILVGIIPNCASSVALAGLFIDGGLAFGALTAGLCVNAGLGLIILFKQNKNWKVNLFIILMLIIPSLIVGYAINLIQFLI